MGYHPEELIGISCYDLMVEADRAASLQATRDAWDGADIPTYENQYYHKDGSIVTIFWEGGWDVNEQLIYTTGRDITEQRRLEKKEQEYQQKLQITKQHLEDLIERITYGFLGLDEQAKVIYWNKAAEAISGLSQQRMVGYCLWDVLPEPTCSLAREKLAQIKMENRPLHIEYFSVRIQRWIEVHAYISETGVSVFFRDVSERKELEQQLLQEREQRHLEKEQAQKKITAAVIKATEAERAHVGRELHDNVNQVLTTVKLYNELCLDLSNGSQELLKKSVALLQNSIDEIRNLSKRLSAPTLGNMRLQDSVNELAESLLATNKIRITLRTDCISDLQVGQEVHLAMYRILQEHLTNVLKHSDARQVTVSFDVNEHMLSLIVTDDGKGFYLQKNRSGNGITNMMTRAENLNGTLTLSSAPGQGCTLLVQLPLNEM